MWNDRLRFASPSGTVIQFLRKMQHETLSLLRLFYSVLKLRREKRDWKDSQLLYPVVGNLTMYDEQRFVISRITRRVYILGQMSLYTVTFANESYPAI